MVPELLVLALDFYRSPLRYPHLNEPGIPLPDAFGGLLIDFVAALSPQNLQGIADQLGESPEAIESAARFFLRQVLLIPGADHYRTLGLPRTAPDTSIRQHYQLLVRLFHPDRSVSNDGMDAALTVRINDAYTTLRHPESRQQYDKDLSGFHGIGEIAPDISAFLRRDPRVHHAIVDERSWMPMPDRLRRWAIWTVLALALALGLIALTLLSQTFDKPVLRSNPQAIQTTEPMPRFLGQHDPIPGHEHASTPSDSIESPRVAHSNEPAKLPEQQPSGFMVLERNQDITPALRAPAKAPRDPRLTENSNTSPSQPEKPPASTDLLPDRPSLLPPSPSASAKSTPRSTTAAAEKQPARQDSERPQPERLAAQTPTESSPRRFAEQLRPSAPPAQPKPPVRSSTEHWSDKTTEANALLRQFVSAYNAGSPDRLVNLFTKDARVVNGRGSNFIRKDYAVFFDQLTEQRIDVAPIQWRSAQGVDLVGVGNARLVIRKRNSTEQQTFAGALDFTLTSTSQGLRIAALLHQLQVAQIARPGKPDASTTKSGSQKAERGISASEANAVVSRLTHAYRQGDVDAITQLFTADAKVNDYSGIQRIRRDYADFFQRYPERKISTQTFSWRTPNADIAIGRTGISIDIKAPGASDWENTRGTMELELVRSQKGLKIKKMTHSLQSTTPP